MLNVNIAQVLLTLVIGMWLSARFNDSEIIKFFGRNDWFVGAFLIIVGYMNYAVYTAAYVRSLNMLLMIIGLVIAVISVTDVLKR